MNKRVFCSNCCNICLLFCFFMKPVKQYLLRKRESLVLETSFSLHQRSLKLLVSGLAFFKNSKQYPPNFSLTAIYTLCLNMQCHCRKNVLIIVIIAIHALKDLNMESALPCCLKQRRFLISKILTRSFRVNSCFFCLTVWTCVRVSSPKWLKSCGGSHLHEEACLDLFLYHLCRRLKPLQLPYQ